MEFDCLVTLLRDVSLNLLLGHEQYDEASNLSLFFDEDFEGLL